MQSDLDTALISFIARFGRDGNDLGAVMLRDPAPLASSDDPPLVLDSALHTYYARLEFIDTPIVGGALQLELLPLSKLSRAQEGWSWVMQDGEMVRNPDWPQAWVIFAMNHGAGVFADVSDPQCPVFGSVQQRNVRIAHSLPAFMTSLAIVMDIEAREFDMVAVDDDWNPLPAFVERVRTALESELQPTDVQGFMDFFGVCVVSAPQGRPQVGQ